jgi:hypothetical protein
MRRLWPFMPFILLPGSSPWKFVSLSIFLLNALEMIRNGQKKAAGEPLIVCGSAMEGKPHLDGSRADGFMPSALYLREDEYGVPPFLLTLGRIDARR